MSTKLPLTPSAARIDAAELLFCSASAKLVGMIEEEVVPLPAEDPLDPLDEEPFDELLDEEPLEPVVEDEPVELLDDEELELLPELDLRALCTAADSAELTRFRASWLAMLDRPWDKVVMASPITLINAASADDA